MTVKGKLLKAKAKIKKFSSSSSEGESGKDDAKGKDGSDSDGDSTASASTKTTAKTEEKGSDAEEEKVPFHDKNFGKRKFVDTDKPATWNVLVRVIEAKDVEPGSARVRVVLDGKSKTTRTVTHAVPKWRQNLLFTVKKQSLEKLSSNLLTIRLVRPTFSGETVHGEFQCFLSEVIHSTDKSVVSKWIALGFAGDEESDNEEFAYENCGFMKVSICVFRMDESPPNLIDDDGKEEIWSGAHLTDYTLRFRMFGIEMLIRKLINEKKVKRVQRFYVQVECGEEKSETSFEVANLDTETNNADVLFDQEIYLPIQWPTVVSQVLLRLFVKKGRGKKCVGVAALPMRKIYEPGEHGFLPTFGPAYLNFFACETETRFNWFSKNPKSLQQDGSRFIARLFLAIDCIEFMGESSAQRLHLDHSSIKEAEAYMKSVNQYVSFCSMSTLNVINPLFASDAIQILVSIGTFGSMSADTISCSSSTVAAMPNWDGCKYFAMPWGNLRPVAEVNCVFENIEDRVELSNALMKMSDMLNKMIWEVRRIGNGAIDHVASVGCEALDYLEQMVEAGSKYLHNFKIEKPNYLDLNWLDSRKRKIVKLKNEMANELFAVDYSDDDVDSKLLRMLVRMRDLAKELADDVQLSIPPVVIKMISHGKLIGFAKIPISEIYQAGTEALSGQWCGRSREISIRWPTYFDQRQRKEEFVAILHARMWFGRSSNLSKWKEHVEPAETRYFMELYETQSRSIVHKWKTSESKMFLDGEGFEVDGIPQLVEGWTTVGKWMVMNTHDMWMSNCGRQTMHDKAYEVQKKDDKGGWVNDKFTDFYGYEVNESDLKKGVSGWEMTAWTADKLRNNGDKNGWVYTTNCIFFGDGVTVDREMKPHHQFRRRCIRRSRKLVSYNKEHEQLDGFRSSLTENNWEYARKKYGPYHDSEDLNDQVRRRRYMIEVEKTNSVTDAPIYRLYEYQLVTQKWQLRCYIMWAKDLLPVVKNSARAFVRISFAHYSKQTLLVDNSQNPIWNETVMFRSVLIAGGTRDIMHYPPVVTVEVVGECANNAEAHLGRFETPPTVICSNTDTRAQPMWHPLRFPKGHTRGAILACFELFEQTDNKDCLPLEPAAKHNHKDKSEIPSELRPQFDKYNVQFLCWGVRNIKKHQLLSVRHPFVELTIGDQEFSMEPLKDYRKNPNFPEAMISFSEVALPSALELSPPFVVNLHDSRSFNRRPLVGTCLITDLHKYVSKIIPKNKMNGEEAWDTFDAIIDEEHQKLIQIPRYITLSTDPMVPLDWWSRYYASMSQFHRAPGYPESGMEYLKVVKRPLEEVNGYNNFSDFLQTFQFVKNAKGDFDDPEEREKAGELKCRLLISKLKKDKAVDTMHSSVDFVGPVKCLVRIYVIEAHGLITSAKKGLIDSYVKAKCGNSKVNSKKNYRAETADPIFGERIELNVTIPLEKDLKITLMDKRRLKTDEEIGSTSIDLENRLLTKWRGLCGLSAQYTIQGEQQWRDQMTPLEILKAYCIRMMLSPPLIVTQTVKNDKTDNTERGITVHGVTFWYSEVLEALERHEQLVIEGQREKAGKEDSGSGESQSNEDQMEVESDRAKNDKEETRKESKKVIKKTKKEEEIDPYFLANLRKKRRKEIMGTDLEVISLYILRLINLVPEHVETRPLYSDKYGKTCRGELRMFVDVFPLEYGSIPAPLDISPRKPINYQLRVAVMNVFGAIPVKRSFAEPASDLYVKVFVNGMTKGHKTDTHFRVTDGNGEFNWRFLINFDYNPWEKKVVAYTKTRLFRKPAEELVDPIVVIQLWDKNKFRKDRLLGEFELDLLNFIEGLDSPSAVGVFASKKRREILPKCCTRRGCCCRCCMFCFETRCLCKRRKVKKKPFPKPTRFVEPEEYNDSVNLFDARNVYGWWPMLTNTYPHDDVKSTKKKDDDVKDDSQWIMGLVEMEMCLLSLQDAEMDPVGKKRSEPNHSPYLEKPTRKNWMNFWLFSRLCPCVKYFWHYYGLQVFLWILVVLILILTIYFLLNTWPVIFSHILTSIW